MKTRHYRESMSTAATGSLPEGTTDFSSRGLARDPAQILDLAQYKAPDLQTTLATYRRTGEKDVRVAANHRENAPLGAPGKVQLALKRLVATASPAECPIVPFAKEAYEAYLDGFYEAMDIYYPSLRFTVPSWEEEQETHFLTWFDMMSHVRRLPATQPATAPTPQPTAVSTAS